MFEVRAEGGAAELFYLKEFPDDYNGMSGGGIWYQMFLTGDGRQFSVKPILAGVACWQSEVTLKRGYKVRCLTGHAWVSIYGYVRRVLAERRASENCQPDL